MTRPAALLLAIVSVGTLLTACGTRRGGGGGGRDDDDDDDDTAEAGDDDDDDDDDEVADGTGESCEDLEDCAYWFCQCEDGGPVNGSLCRNGSCLDDSAACPPACADFGYGRWTGTLGGGPDDDGGCECDYEPDWCECDCDPDCADEELCGCDETWECDCDCDPDCEGGACDCDWEIGVCECDCDPDCF